MSDWTTASVIAIRHRLGVDRSMLARIAGVDLRTVTRWETGSSKPSGTSEAVLTAIREKLDTDPAQAEKVVEFITRAASVGGLAYLLLKLLDEATKPGAMEAADALDPKSLAAVFGGLAKP